MNGKTIEVINTDAEGRLILADALVLRQQTRRDEDRRRRDAYRRLRHRARARSSAAVIPTTTRSASEFLAAAKPTRRTLLAAAATTTTTRPQMKSDIADLKNTGGRAAGTLTAAAFLREFVDRRAVDSPRHRRHGVSRQRIGVASEGSDRDAGARLRRAGRIARARRRRESLS